MYYAEKIINGILHCKHTPNGKWNIKCYRGDIDKPEKQTVILIDKW